MSTTPTPAGAPAGPASTRATLDQLRRALSSALLAVALLCAVVALYPVARGLPLRENWAYLVWGGLAGVAALACAALYLVRRSADESADLLQLQQVSGLSCLALMAAFASIPIYLVSRHPFDVAISPLFLWAATLAAALLTFGVIFLTAQAWQSAPLDRFRVTVVGLSGVAGLVTFVFGVTLALTTYREDLVRGVEQWRQNPLALILPGGATVGSLVLMFLTLQLVRDMDRVSSGMRRLVYGYNAGLTTILLVMILVILNIVSHVDPFKRYLTAQTDWTQSRFRSLGDQTKKILAELQEPIKVQVLLPRNSMLNQDVRDMLEECKLYTNKLTVQELSTNSPGSEAQLEEIVTRYGLTDPRGVLVTTGGEGKDGKGDHEFIRPDQLRVMPEMNPMNPEPPSGKEKFNGENALVNAIRNLTEGKTVLYFTTGSGEAELKPAGEAVGTPEASLSALQRRLSERKNVEVKELRLGLGGETRVPDDASVVVVVRPTQPFTPEAAGVLREYVKAKKGKLLLLLEPVIVSKGGTRTLVPTGLDSLLAEFGVQVGNNQVLVAARPNYPTLVQAVANPNSTSGLGQAFRGELLEFQNSRTVDQPREGAPPPGGYKVLPLIYALPEQGIWAEKDIAKEPTAAVKALLADRELQIKNISRRPLSLAVTVSTSEGPGGMPNDAAHARAGKERPALVVYGNSQWATDKTLGDPNNSHYYNLFSSSVSWLREKSSQGTTVDAKEKATYKWNIPEQNVSRLIFLPPTLMILGVVVLGTGVWVVRRR